jgi:hypothetical protein
MMPSIIRTNKLMKMTAKMSLLHHQKPAHLVFKNAANPLSAAQTQIEFYRSNQAKDLADVVGANGERKAEGLLPLDESASGLRVLILFDSEKEGAPVAVMIPRP